jgi:hypothetical protein
MIKTSTLAIFTVAALIVAAPGLAIEASTMFAPYSGVEVIDHGTLVISGGSSARNESFEILRRPDGGRTIVSVTTAADGSYRVQGRWDYDADERALSAHGLGLHSGQEVAIDIAAAPPAATMRLAAADGSLRTFHAPCDPPCLIDMTPSALPMFTMTRLYDFEAGGVQQFRWIGYALNQDQRLIDGTVRFRFVKEFEVERPGEEAMNVRHFIWDETLVEETTGKTFEVHFNAWTDTDHRPLKFQVGKWTAGIRDGYQAISDQLVPN